ncbi:MAG TPA: FtsK/SpoIIIE domain-containing protein, partial [Sporichthyaceae bacterium]|nr:FtsK/SpoIIIE domain-containing protein [Sporichthyaceae bacterium]
MQLRVSVNSPGRAGTDLFVDADPATPVSAFGDQIVRALGVGQAAQLFLDGFEVEAGLPLDSSPIRDGVALGLGEPVVGVRSPGQGIVEIRVAGGPGAGGLYRLGPGEFTIGSTANDRIRLEDAGLSAGALTVTIGADGAATVRPGPTVQATLEGERVSDPTPWPPAHLLSVGAVLLDLAPPDFPDAALAPSEDGAGFDYTRPPRLALPEHPTRFALPTAPATAEKRPLPWVMAVVPLVVALVLAAVTHNTSLLALALLSPISLIANQLNERKQGKQSAERTHEEYRARRTAIESDAQDAMTAEQAARRTACPDPAVVRLIATGPRQRLWERRRADPDHGRVRLGTGTLPSAVVLTDPSLEEHRRGEPLLLAHIPVTVDLTAYGVLGLAGRAAAVHSAASWILVQSAVLTSPADLSICVLTDPAGAAGWSWVAWLPHARPRDGQDAVALLGTTAETVGRRISELLNQLAARQKAVREAGSSARLDAPDVLVVLDGSRRLRSLPGVAQLLADGPAVGIRLLCLETEARLLPEECKAVATLGDDRYLTLRQAGLSTVDRVVPDLVGTDWCERIARALAPIRDVSRDEDSALPDSSRLLDVLGLEPPTADAIVAGWRAGGATTRAAIGISLDGSFVVDLRRDGPHGLIAGTTGSGKSELLQTIIASLAVANRPDAMTFVLVDYKGGSAFAECARLPHTVGMVTDLDEGLVTRALESLSAELRRREHLFAAAGTPDLEAYVDARRRDPALAAVPRLLIVIDEFASLARELPDFVTGLVSIAQRGRSLGIHLILATQRPSGVVSAEIRANTDLRIALRVTDPAESSDVIDAPDAARIAKSTPGRAYVRLGHAALLPFQAARVGGRRPGVVATGGAVVPPYVVPLAVDALGQPQPSRPAAPGTTASSAVTDLSVLVEAIRAANVALELPRQPSPWLPPLPTAINLDDLDRPSRPTDSAGTLRPAPFALADLPASQSREVESVDLARFGHLFIAGSPRSGRSQVLRTIAGSLARENSSADVHLFGLDCGNGALLPLAKLPHCGAVVRSGETERAERLLTKLAGVTRERMTQLGERGFTDISEQRAAVPADERMPHLVVLLDRWEGFLAGLGERDGGALVDLVLRLLREGAGVGVHLIITGDQSLLGGRMGSLTEQKIALRLADKGDFGLIGISARAVPDKLGDGRGYRVPGGAQLQVALLDADPSGASQAAALERIAAAARERDGVLPPSRQPFGVDVLPTRISFDAAWRLQMGDTGPLWGMVAVGGDRLTAYGPDLAVGTPAFLLGGPPGSGRSTALCCLAASYLAAGTRVLLVLPRPSPLQRLGGEAGVVAVVDGSSLEPGVLATAAAVGSPLVVLVDDAELVRDTTAAEELTAILRRQRGPVGLVLAGDAESVGAGFGGWQVEARKARRGLLLSPQNLTDADLIGTRVPRTMIGLAV